ncbi:DUF441 domain-containing protein [Pelotomaculum propionicicum]|uniref:UPF0756 membrane protein Pmgp_02482 n=1 Tax=Pelotomaculum propionicicum TaxID=258475 RepID=A0A4Y7RMT2_9FIRM|nr:DUF441 domain-containing protein [Pelotomaculum propionicicum]NLI12859.1 DUF441 domain-containing protein [Peptococcaceae bacterium]TEB10285.1 hypothetical protein Pmgp_02482 [Pelotomaculum propionicicum]
MLVALLLVGIVAQSNLIVTATCILLVIKFTNLQVLFPLLEKRGLELGLLFLMLSILVPLANGMVSVKDIFLNTVSLPGILAVAGGAVATHLNARGLTLLKVDPEIVFGMVLGSILGIVFLHGVPVGPLMAAGIAALLMPLVKRLRR